MASVEYTTNLPAYEFIVRGSTTYEHLFGFTLVETGVTNTVGPFAEADDVADFIRTTFENHPDVHDVTVTKRVTTGDSF